MIKEFAVEPALLGDWRDCLYLIEKFDLEEKGRVISWFPENWRKLVLEAADRHSVGVKDRKYIEEKFMEKFRKHQSAMVPSWRDCQDPENWFKSAEVAHQEKPFHAIIAEHNPNGHSHVISYKPGDSIEEHILFKCPTECSMPKDTEGFCGIAGPLIRYSKRIIFVDPHFFNNDYTLKNWGKPLEALLRNISVIGGKYYINKMPRYCTSAYLNGETAQYRQGRIERNLPAYVPRGLKLEVLLLSKLAGEDTHNRYILTDRGGLKFPWGLDVRKDGARDVVNLMDAGTRAEMFQYFGDGLKPLLDLEADDSSDESSGPYCQRRPVIKSFVIVGKAKPLEGLRGQNQGGRNGTARK